MVTETTGAASQFSYPKRKRRQPQVSGQKQPSELGVFAQHGLKREEIARLLVAALGGAPEAEFKKILQSLCGINAETAEFGIIQSAISAGKWETVHAQLDTLDFMIPENRKEASLLVCQHWFYDLIEENKLVEATQLLRTHITPLDIADPESYTWLLLSPQSLDQTVSNGTQRRKKLIEELTKLLDPAIVVPTNRLATLLADASHYQDIVYVRPLTPVQRKSRSKGQKKTHPTMYPEIIDYKWWKIDHDTAIVHGVHALGFPDLANKLADHFHVQLQSPECKVLQENINQNMWEPALAAVAMSSARVPVPALVAADKNSIGLFDTAAAQNSALSLILRHAVDNLVGQNTHESRTHAVTLARRFGHMTGDQDALGMLLSSTGGQLSKDKLWPSLVRYISTSALVPDDYLAVLLNNARKYSALMDPYWCGTVHELDDISVLSDFESRVSDFPSFKITKADLSHSDEVWEIAFSNNGEYLAVGTKSGELTVWSTDTFELMSLISRYHKKGIQTLAWSPNDSMLVSGGEDGYVNMWLLDSDTRKFSVKGYERGAETPYRQISSVCWLPSGDRFLSGGVDGSLVLWSTEGEKIWKHNGIRVMSLAVFDEGRKLAILSVQQQNEGLQEDQRLYILNIENWEVGEELKIKSLQLTSLSLSSDSRYFLMNSIPDSLRIWDIFEQDEQSLKCLEGPIQEEETIRSRFGGPWDKYVLSGSEDRIARIYNRFSGALVASLEAHSRGVNTVHWCPGKKLIATAGDDGKVFLWSPEDAI